MLLLVFMQQRLSVINKTFSKTKTDQDRPEVSTFNTKLDLWLHEQLTKAAMPAVHTRTAVARLPLRQRGFLVMSARRYCDRTCLSVAFDRSLVRCTR